MQVGKPVLRPKAPSCGPRAGGFHFPVVCLILLVLLCGASAQICGESVARMVRHHAGHGFSTQYLIHSYEGSPR